jgi:hypothetical protein
VETHPGFLMPICRIGHSSYASVGLSKQVALDTAWQDFEMFFDGTISDTACRVDFQVSKSDSLIWFDNVSLYEINNAGLTRDLRSRCFYNTNISDQVFGLGGDTWREVNGTRGIRGSITLPAFLSRVMVNGIVDKIKMKNPARLLFVRQVGPGIIKVGFTLKTKQDVKIEICNLRGAIVYSSGNKEMNAGHHGEVLMRGNRIAAGMYIVKVTTMDFVASQRIEIVN